MPTQLRYPDVDFGFANMCLTYRPCLDSRSTLLSVLRLPLWQIVRGLGCLRSAQQNTAFNPDYAQAYKGSTRAPTTRNARA